MDVTEMKKCPYCSEEIAVEAKKCKHCGEWFGKKPPESTVIKKEKEEDESVGFIGRVIGSLIIGGISWLLFYFGSWHFILGEKISMMMQYLTTGSLKAQNFILEEDGFVFRINEKYYGFIKDGHFFDSPVIQWIMLFSALIAFVGAIEMLLLGSFLNDD